MLHLFVVAGSDTRFDGVTCRHRSCLAWTWFLAAAAG